MPRRIPLMVAALAVTTATTLTGCTSIPADAAGTLDRARGGTLVVGVSEHHPWTDVSPDRRYSGSEVELLESFADSIDAEIEWHAAPESVLAGRIKNDLLDVVIGGLTTSTPWTTHMAITRSYAQVDGENMVMGVRMGENELMVALERHLAQEHGEI